MPSLIPFVLSFFTDATVTRSNGSAKAVGAALVSLAILAINLSPTSASAGFLDDLFGGPSPTISSPQPQLHRAQRYKGSEFPSARGSDERVRRHASLTNDRRLIGSISAGEIKPRALSPRAARKSAHASADSGGGAEIGKFVCVRMCDGAVIALARRSGASAGLPSCDSACPGAEARLYSLHSSGDDIGTAVDPVTHTSYSDLVARVKEADDRKSCSCGSVVSRADVDVDDFLADATLRDGDVVATSEGLHIFRGQRRLPHKLTEFLAFQDARARMSRSTHGALQAIQQTLKTKGAASEAANEGQP